MYSFIDLVPYTDQDELKYTATCQSLCDLRKSLNNEDKAHGWTPVLHDRHMK